MAGCGKIPYGSAAEAWRAARSVRQRHGPEVYAYRCRNCGGAWHLASRATRKDRLVLRHRRQRAERLDGE